MEAPPRARGNHHGKVSVTSCTVCRRTSGLCNSWNYHVFAVTAVRGAGVEWVWCCGDPHFRLLLPLPFPGDAVLTILFERSSDGRSWAAVGNNAAVHTGGICEVCLEIWSRVPRWFTSTAHSVVALLMPCMHHIRVCHISTVSNRLPKGKFLHCFELLLELANEFEKLSSPTRQKCPVGILTHDRTEKTKRQKQKFENISG